MPYLYDAHSGGTMISDHVATKTEDRLRRFAHERFGGSFRELGVWFRGPFCYLDLYQDPGPLLEGWSPTESTETREQYRDRVTMTPIPVCRLRYFGNPDRWSFAVYDPETGLYEPAFFPSGAPAGPAEDALDCALMMRLA